MLAIIINILFNILIASIKLEILLLSNASLEVVVLESAFDFKNSKPSFKSLNLRITKTFIKKNDF